ncbi:5-hydroxytryptamine receptor 3A-like [Chanos chanos]|uniref:5-hydroxytryptamine receptor 3A-like n=1 Tax=Chanos chanos TaxID=29144 RepID=A0A6J2WQ21_CHACN|nr:5-hydroxytryptamine receptor 3A-like [Chanos chanos]
MRKSNFHKGYKTTAFLKPPHHHNDPDLTWNVTKYKFRELMLPADKIWTPQLSVDNAINTEIKPLSSDLMVYNDGTVEHSVVMFTTVICEISLYTYPFVQDSCVVALNGWQHRWCGLRVRFGNVSTTGSSHGEWKTIDVALTQMRGRGDRNFLSVTVTINPFGPTVTLILPSILIMIADLISFALPSLGGERNSFKVTLVLSFTMFLLILTDHLPDDGRCSPLLRYHFCFCLVSLVVSMLLSMLSTRIADDGSLVPSRCIKSRREKKNRKDSLDHERDAISSVTVTKSAESILNDAAIKRITAFVENMEEELREKDARQSLANTVDKFCFWGFFILYVIYSICIISYAQADFCKVNNLEFWETDFWESGEYFNESNYNDSYYYYDYYYWYDQGYYPSYLNQTQNYTE